MRTTTASLLLKRIGLEQSRDTTTVYIKQTVTKPLSARKKHCSCLATKKCTPFLRIKSRILRCYQALRYSVWGKRRSTIIWIIVKGLNSGERRTKLLSKYVQRIGHKRLHSLRTGNILPTYSNKIWKTSRNKASLGIRIHMQSEKHKLKPVHSLICKKFGRCV